MPCAQPRPPEHSAAYIALNHAPSRVCRYGARNYKLVGLWAQRGLLLIACLCVPIFCLWFWGTSAILSVLGIERATSALAQDFTRIQTLWMLPVFLNRVVQTYWRAQRIVKPYKNATVAAFVLHVPTCVALSHWYGFYGAAWSLPLNQWLLFGMCVALDRWQRISARCWPPWTAAALRGWAPLLQMGAAGTLTTMGAHLLVAD
jgi:multidrug resistance protein, MATE family